MSTLEAGLEPYTFAEVKNSPWIAQLEEMNRIHPQHSPELFAADRHFILPFHDETFECVARAVTGESVHAKNPSAAIRDISP